MPDIKYTASLDASGMEKGGKQAQKALADLANESNKMDSTLGKKLPAAARVASQSLFNLTEKLNQLKSAVFTEKDINKVKVYNREIASVEKQMATLQTAGTSSFNAIGSGAGKAFGALRTIANILPGIGIAGLLAFAIDPLIKYGAALFGVSEESKKAAEEIKKFKEELKNAESGALATGLKLQGYINIAKTGDLPQKQRTEALKEANKILGNYGEKLTLANVATEAITKQTQAFTNALIQQALATKLADRAADLLIRQRDASKAYGVELDKLNKKQASFNNTFNANSSNASEAAAARLQNSARAVEDQRDAVVEAATAYKDVTAQVKDLTTQLFEAQLASSGLFGELGERSTEKAKRSIKTIQDVLAELQREIDFFSAKGIAFNTNEERAKISAIVSTIEKLIKDFKVAPDDTIIAKLFGDAELLRNRIKPQEIQKAVTDAAKVLGEKGVLIPIQPVLNKDAIDVFLIDATDKIESTLENLFTNIGVAIGDTLGKALAGSASIGDFFKNIFSQLGTAMQELGKFFISTGIVIQKIKQFLIKNPAIAIAGGIALVALGGLIKAKTDAPGFATGVRNFGGGIATVGERGPETVFLPRGSSVLPAAQTSAGLGGQTVFIADSIVKGNDIVTAYKRTQAALGRTG